MGISVITEITNTIDRIEVLAPAVPAWGVMWIIAVGMFLAAKVATVVDARGAGRRATAYVLAWPGMNARAFLGPADATVPPAVDEWLVAAGRATLGVALVWMAAPLAFRFSPLLAGWL